MLIPAYDFCSGMPQATASIEGLQRARMQEYDLLLPVSDKQGKSGATRHPSPPQAQAL